MAVARSQVAPGSTASGNHFSCSMTAVVLTVVQAYGGSPAVRELLRTAGSDRSPEYLLDTGNWISYDERLRCGERERR